ncbi:hypothetical protein Bca4012_081586 [Brassica carinata]
MSSEDGRPKRRSDGDDDDNKLKECMPSEEESMIVGGIHDLQGNQNSGEIESLARFAIQEHNNRENKVLEFKKIVKAREQVVAGIMYYLTLEANEGGQMKNFEAKVWVKPWMNFKQLQEFKESSS